MSGDLPKVLSIQSHVVHGYVGNNCATFPLQLLGFDVCAINSVQFSNHKAYKNCTGQVFTADDVQDLYKGLRDNDVDNFSHVLTGYVGNPTFLSKVCDIIAELKAKHPRIVYVCDPVMGDNGHLYVPKELVPIYKDKVLPLADVIVPNQFEAEWLTDQKISTEWEAIAAMDKLHEKGVATVIISSSNLGTDDTLLALASSHDDGRRVVYRMIIPRLRGIFVGTGDLLTATLLAWLHREKNLKAALEKSMSTVHKVILRTLNASLECCRENERPTAAEMELRLIQSKEDIERPGTLLKSEMISL